jgi:hypothetical protein
VLISFIIPTQSRRLKSYPNATISIKIRANNALKSDPMKEASFSLNSKDEKLAALVERSSHRVLAAWVIDCVERVLPYFENEFPHDARPRAALETLQEWRQTGEFSMKVIRSAALGAHAAAREVGADSPARSAARAAGQAVACAHVPAHALAAANYALQAVHRAHSENDPVSAVADERAWQYQHLLELQHPPHNINIH